LGLLGYRKFEDQAQAMLEPGTPRRELEKRLRGVKLPKEVPSSSQTAGRAIEGNNAEYNSARRFRTRVKLRCEQMDRD
jgi:hypothetical protein